MKTFILAVFSCFLFGSSVPAFAQVSTSIPSAQILETAFHGDTEKLKELLSAGGNADATNDKGYSALYFAVIKGHVETAQLLLSSGAKGLNDPQGRKRASLLCISAWGADPEMAKMLIQNGADVHFIDADGLDAVAAAIASKSNEILLALLDAGADPNQRLKGGLNSVSLAALHGNVEALKILLDRNGNIDSRDDLGVTPLMFAVSQKQEEAARILLDRGAPAYPLNAWERNVLGEAKLIKDTEVRQRLVDMLLASGAKDGNPLRPVDTEYLKAVFNGNLRQVKAALEKGADLHARGKYDGHTYYYNALSGAVEHPQVLRFLIDQHINAFMQTSEEFTALHFAARDGTPEVIEMLIAKGLDPNRRTKYGFTPLNMATNGIVKLANVRTLIKLNADPNGKTLSGEPLLSQAKKLKNPELVKLLIDAGAQE